MNKYNRKSIRLKNFDYSQEGGYFITICTKERRCLFGEMVDKEMRLNECGEIVQEEWEKTAMIRSNIHLDEYIVMPNHIHGIIIMDKQKNDRRGVLQYAPTAVNSFRSPSQTIGSIIRGFKSTVTKQINILRGFPESPVWQRNYYEHIVRGDNDLNRIREYIHGNPLNWDGDQNNPKNFKK